MIRITLPLILLSALLPAQTNSMFTISATGTVTSVTNGKGVLLTGTATLTGFGTAQLTSNFTIPTSGGIVASTPIAATAVLVFSTGDVLLGQVVVPAGYFIPQLGQTTSAAASFTIAGGSGEFVNASGSFPNLTVNATITGNGATVLGSGSGTVLTPSAHTVGTPSYSGSFAHFASGAGWDTIITLVNKGTANAQAQVNFYNESGSPATLPLDFPQGGASSTSAPTYSQVLKPGAVLVIDSQGGATTSVGSAQLLSDGNVSGYLIFRYLPTVQEAAVPLQVQNSSTYTLPFDNTGGISTGIALSATSTTSTAVQVLVLNDAGTTIATDTITLPGLGHTSFVLGTRYTSTGNVRGTIQFQAPPGAEIGVIGIRALASGAYTTIPPIGN
ncbi:MAG TPA: hypothetical protein VK752_19860 [Bryobacteraceae bacterium]|jgi:hypothetical protein|nr:hypothetical protein [Bryobacteraceae bacterium]